MKKYFTIAETDGTDVQLVTARHAYELFGDEEKRIYTFSAPDESEQYMGSLRHRGYTETLTRPPFSTEEANLMCYELREDALNRIERQRDVEQRAFLRNWLTEYSHGRWQNEEITDTTALTLAHRRLERDTFKVLAEEEANLSAILTASEPQTITALVEFGRGNAVHATIRVDDTCEYKGVAYGYGYDRTSAALADALNKSNGALAVLAHAKLRALENGETDVSNTATCGRCNHGILGYASGYGVIPYVEGGTGAHSVLTLFVKQGYVVNMVNGNDAIAYTITKKEV